jgi:hypothetical protein
MLKTLDWLCEKDVQGLALAPRREAGGTSTHPGVHHGKPTTQGFTECRPTGENGSW